MPFALPEGLAPEVYPLAWLVGHWRGEGVVSYPSIPETPIRQDVVVDHDGGPYLRWRSTLWLAPEEAGDAADETADAARPEPSDAELQVWATETGYWRVPPDRPEGVPADRHPVELMLVDPAGHMTLYMGVTGNGRIDLASDAIVRTPDAAAVAASTRLMGLVHGELMWTWDIAAFGEPLQSYASARLSRVEP